MTSQTTALRVDLDGRIRELDIGTTRNEQIRIIGRALLDNIDAVDFIRRPTGPDLVVFARAHRAHQALNLHAANAVHQLAAPLPHLIAGEVVFAGYTAAGDLTGLPEDAAETIRAACQPL
ncbi:hypothetical protein OTB20_34285 [Streptomyces sp. H27-H1]|uniref:hypothetical protein n=1 Tax=unclassified Streptomyces TaxID=2593676 RepID=UPI002270DEB2|nr:MULTISPECIES: hypothetical protein [unclassified Streptomyces]MCY0931165.1 hypothetical protein [Streptomyces sp. H27-H1]MCY0939240.1 hypothetical protein [Streptomyces sp. H34-S4]